MVKWTMFVAVTLLPLSAQGDQPATQASAASAPQVQPWHKPVYPQSRTAFIEGFKQAGYAMVCGVKEVRECMGFTNDCTAEISVNTDKCVTENSARLPMSFASPDEAKPINKALFACVAEKQRLSGKGQISLEACNKVNEMRKQSAPQHQ